MTKTEDIQELERDPEALQILKAMARIRDPMTRYLISMLIDRLTEQVEKILQNQDGVHVPAKDARSKIN